MASATGFSWSSTKSYWDGGITKIPEFHLRYAHQTEVHRGPEHYYGIIRESTRIAKWSKLYERFWGFPGRWVGAQWKFSRYQSTRMIPSTSSFWGIIEAFIRIAGHIHCVRKRFCKSTSSLSSRIELSLEENCWRTDSHVHSGEEWWTRTRSRSEMPVWTVSQRFQSSSVEETFQRIMGQTNKDCRSQIFISTSSLRQQPSLRPRYVLVHNFLRKLCIGSMKWSWLNQWTNWDLRHLLVVFQCRILKYLMRGLLQPWTKSSTIPSSKGESVWRNKKPRKRTVSFEVDRLPTWSTNNSGSLGAHDSVENYTDLFTIVLRNDDVQEFDSEWDGILLSMTKIPHDDILEGLHKLRIRVSEKLKTVLELYDFEIHQKELGPDYHRLKTMVKRSIEQEIRNKNFGSRIGNFEKNAVVKNQGTKQRVQRILEVCWQWETNGQCVKGNNCSFRHDMNKRGKSHTIKSVSEFFHAAEWAKTIEDPKSQRQKSEW